MSGRGKEITHHMQLSDVTVASTPEQVRAQAKELGLEPVRTTQPQPSNRKPDVQKPQVNGDKNSKRETTTRANSNINNSGSVMNQNQNTQPAAAPVTPQQPGPGPYSAPSPTDLNEMRQFAQMMASVMPQPAPVDYNALAQALVSVMPQPAPQQSIQQPQPNWLQPQPEKKELASYFEKFNGVSVGEKVLTAGGYGLAAVGTFAGCIGVGRLFGVPWFGGS